MINIIYNKVISKKKKNCQKIHQINQLNLEKKNCVEINDDSIGTYNTISQVKFKTSVLRTSICDYSDTYILKSGTIKITGAGDNDADRRLDEINKGVIFKKCASFSDYISEINNAQINNAKYIDVVMPIYDLIEYSDNYSKKSGSLRQYYRDDLNDDDITESESFKYKTKITGTTPVARNKKVVETDLSYFWRKLEMPLMNCEINLILTQSQDCIISSTTAEAKFK